MEIQSRGKRPAQQALDPASHLLGGLVREGDRQHLVGLRVAVTDEIGRAIGDDARLARAGAGQDQQRALAVQHGALLFGIELVEEGHRGTTEK